MGRKGRDLRPTQGGLPKREKGDREMKKKSRGKWELRAKKRKFFFTG